LFLFFAPSLVPTQLFTSSSTRVIFISYIPCAICPYYLHDSTHQRLRSLYPSAICHIPSALINFTTLQINDFTVHCHLLSAISHLPLLTSRLYKSTTSQFIAICYLP